MARGRRKGWCVAIAALLIGGVPRSALAARSSVPTAHAGAIANQGCLDSPAESGRPAVAWDHLHNPILSYDLLGVRDPGVRIRHGEWNVLFTTVVGGAPQWGIGSATAADLHGWGSLSTWTPQPGTAGLASPDVTRSPTGTYVVTYQSDPAETVPRGEPKLYYRTSSDLKVWGPPHRLMAGLHSAPSDRLIDAALAWTSHGLFLGYKFGKDTQHFEMAWSPSGRLEGPWRYVGRPDISVYNDTIENYQFLQIDGRWNLLATSNNFDRPWLFQLVGDPGDPNAWVHWTTGRELEVPAESWNRAAGIPSVDFEQENSAYLCDLRAVDGYFYLFYIGTNKLRTYGGWGHTKLGVARSRDLILWNVPCGGAGPSSPLGCDGLSVRQPPAEGLGEARCQSSSS